MSLRYYILVTILLLGFSSCRRDPYLNPNKAYKDYTFTNYFNRTSGWVAGDGAYSIPLSNGKSLWAFGDSYIDSYDAATQSVPCLFQARNALLLMGIVNPLNQQTIYATNGTNSYFLPADGQNWIWPGTGYQNGDTIFLFVGKLGQGVPDTQKIAKVMLSNYSLNSYYTLPYCNGINFSYAIVQADGYRYIYGTKSNGFGNDLFVARYPENNIYANWEYYNGNGNWGTDINTITRIWDEFTSSFYVCKIKNKYVLITTEFSVGCDEGRSILVATADNPYGPFTSQHSIWQVDDSLEGHYPFFYIANPHPEYDNGHDELLITYCINGYGNCVNTCINGRMDPNVYRPKAIRVPYKAIDPSL